VLSCLVMACTKLFAALVFCSLTFASPLHPSVPPATRSSNGTPTIESAFAKSPSSRGTTDLISSCLTTLGLCVWTAVHLNVPQNSSRVRSTANRVAWMLMAAFLPEFVLWRALRQWTAARDLLKTVNTMGSSAAAGMQLVRAEAKQQKDSVKC
jgi:hypothetical protein